MAREPQSKYQNPNPGYRKGDQHSTKGKNRRPQDGFEKGDARRRVDVHEGTVPVKPGKPAKRLRETRRRAS